MSMARPWGQRRFLSASCYARIVQVDSDCQASSCRRATEINFRTLCEFSVRNIEDEMNTLLKHWPRMIGAACMLICVSVLGAPNDQAVQQVRALNAEVAKLTDDNRFQDALPAAQNALESCERTLGSRHAETATAVDQLAQLYWATGKYPEAESLYRRALSIRTDILGPEHPETAKTLNNLGLLYMTTGAYAKAEPLYKRALAIREKVLGPAHADTARSLSNLGILYSSTGAYAKAEPLYKRSLGILTKAFGPEHPNTAQAINNLGGFYYSTGAYAKAEPLLQQVLTIRQKILGSESRGVARSLSNLAGVYVATGAYAKAQPLYQRALAVNEKVMGAEHPDTATSLKNLASANAGMRDFNTAASLLQLAISIQEKALGSEHPELADTINALAVTYVRGGNYAQAQPLYQRALAIQEKVLGPEHPSTATSLDNLAELSRLQGEYVQAELLHQRAVAAFEKSFGNGHPLTAAAVSNFAKTSWALGDTSRALSLFQRSQSARIRNTDQLLLAGSESRNQAYLQSLSDTTFAEISFSMGLPSSEAAKLGLISVLQHKGRVLDATSGSAQRVRRSLSSQDKALLEDLAQAATQLSTLTYQGPGNLSAQAYQERLVQLSKDLEELQAKLARRSSNFRQQIVPISIEAIQRQIPANAAFVEWFRYRPLDPKSAGTQSPPVKPRYVAYVLKRGTEPAAIDVGDAGDIEAAVSSFRRALSSPTQRDVKALAAALSDKLLKSMRPELRGARHWLMSPDGALNLVPMAALLDEQGDYLASHVEISYLTSGRDLLRRPAVSRGKPIVVANPAYGKLADPAFAGMSEQQTRSVDMDNGELQFRPLPNSVSEAQMVKALLQLDESSVLAGANATEARVKQLRAPRILHVVSHGFFLQDQQQGAEFVSAAMPGRSIAPLGENPLLRSGIALAGANARRSGKDDGILTALEMAQLDLDGTALVVLSACEGGVGEVENGEGVYGLRRALVLAGAQTQITSLWKVSDVATRELMSGFYRRLLKGEGRAAALRAAQQEMLSQRARGHPYFWAGFILTGDWTAVAVRQSQ
jgi:CHAT domain-containing protein/Tfp pilus assembly protein PilF